jgi:hypothetical protein
MANEFVARKGLIVSSSAFVTGSVRVTAHVSASAFSGSGANVTGVVSSSYAQTSSFALNAGGSIEITGSAPSSPTAGDLWYDNTTGKTYIYYTSGSVSQWVLQSDPTYNPGPSIQDFQDVTDLSNITTNQIKITNETNATSTLTGALIVSGGLGVNKSIVATSITGSLRYSDLVNGPSGLVSSSTQIAASLPSGLVSSSTQVLPAGVYSSSAQLPEGIVSSSAQVETLLPIGTFSSSAQLPAGTISASSQVQLENVTGTTFATADFTFPQNLTVAGRLTAEEFHTEFVSSSIIYRSGSTKFGDSADDTHIFTGSLTVLGTISGSLILPPGTVSASGQVSYTGLSSIPTGIISSSTQITPLLPTGTVSASSQVSYTSLSNIPADIVSSSTQVITLLPAGTVSSSTQLPDGIVSSSTQVIELLPEGVVSSSDQATTWTVASSSVATSASYALTASYALNASQGGGGTGAGFPFSGSAVITGSMYITGSEGSIPLEVVSPTGSILVVSSDARIGINLTNPQYALHVSGAIFATEDVVAFSDARVKKNITPITNSLELIKQIEGIKFHRIEQDDDAKQQIGFIAQNLNKVLPEVVIGDEKFGYGVSYGNITALLVEAVKAQQQQIDELKMQLEKKIC